MEVREVASYENKTVRVTEERETLLIEEKLFIRPIAVIWIKNPPGAEDLILPYLH